VSEQYIYLVDDVWEKNSDLKKSFYSEEYLSETSVLFVIVHCFRARWTGQKS